MEAVLGSLFPVLVAALILYRVVTGMAQRSRRRPQPHAGPLAEEPYEEIRRRVEQRRRELELARQQMEWEEEEPDWPPPLESGPPPEGLPPGLAVAEDVSPDHGPEEAKAPKGADLRGAPTTAKRQHASPASALDNRRTLRQAVLAQEILGPPVSLRPPEEGG
jgi:hypothetical protein